jgi:drug/metabolite transporter (DMT)-like permease
LAIYAWFHGGNEGGDFLADVMLFGAVIASAYGYSEGAKLTKVMPPWQVPTWCVIMFLPISLVTASISFVSTRAQYEIVSSATFGLLFTSFGSMYLGFFAWYRGLAELGVTRGSQIQLMQPLLTLLWSFALLGEHISNTTLIAAIGVLACIAITQRARHWQHIPPHK